MTLTIRNIFTKTRTHLRDEDGSANAEWVVIVASVVGLTAASTASISGAVTVLSSSVSSEAGGKQVDNGD